MIERIETLKSLLAAKTKQLKESKESTMEQAISLQSHMEMLKKVRDENYIIDQCNI
jgi:hypothetical protein